MDRLNGQRQDDAENMISLACAAVAAYHSGQAPSLEVAVNVVVVNAGGHAAAYNYTLAIAVDLEQQGMDGSIGAETVAAICG